MIQFYLKSELLQFMYRIWVSTREYLTYICRLDLVPLGNIGEYHISITTTISRMILVRWINIGWAVSVVTKFKLMGTSLYNIIKGNTTKFDMGGRLMDCFSVTKNGGLE